MRALRFLALLVLGLLAFGGSLFLAAKALGVDSPVFAFAVVGATLGFVVVTMPVIRWPLPGAVMGIRAWEQSDAVYRQLGTAQFGALLRRSPFRHFNSTVYVRGRPGAVVATRQNMIAAEAAHIWAALLTLPIVAGLAMRGSWIAVAWITAFSVVVNLYPVLHLRMMRAKVEAVIRRRARRDSVLAPAASRQASAPA